MQPTSVGRAGWSDHRGRRSQLSGRSLGLPERGRVQQCLHRLNKATTGPSLVRLTVGPYPPVGIDHAEYSAIAKAKQGVVTALALEEKFSLLLENYAEYSELLDVAVRSSIFSHQEWGEFQADIHAVNRRLVNLLTATKLYADHVDHELIQFVWSGCGSAQQVRDERDKSRASVLSWRALELLRNVVQHRGFPVHELSLESSGDHQDPRSRVRTAQRSPLQ